MTSDTSRPQRYCRNCGGQIRLGNAFCAHCGLQLEDPAASTSLEKREATNFNFGGRVSKSKLRNLWHWFKEQSLARKVLVVLAILVPLTILSPLAFIATVLFIAVCIVGLVVRAIKRRSWKSWGMAAVIAVVPAFIFGGLSNAVYSTSSLESNSTSSEDSGEEVVSGATSEFTSADEDPVISPPVSSSTPEERFLSDVEDDPTLNTLPEATVLGLGTTTCAAFDSYAFGPSGTARDNVYYYLYQNSPSEYGQQEIVAIMVLATVHLCPEYFEEIENE